MATLRFTDDDRGPDGKIMTLDQLLSSSRAAIIAPSTSSTSDDLPDPFADHTTAPDRAVPTKRPMSRAEYIGLSIVAIALAIVFVVWLGSSGERPAVAPQPAPAAPQEYGGRTPVPPPTPEAVMLPAFAAPDGAELGQIEATRAITTVAHYGADWIQADVQGSGLVWLRVSDWPQLAIVGPDLAPQPTATARPVPPTPTPEPQPPCAEAGVPGKMVEVCGWGDLASEAQAKWLATYGGNPGIVTTPTPAEWSKP